MRNLKRALSLALATVMTVGMMVVGTGASYADVKAADNVEAIEVLQAVGIMTGDEKGNFNPDANVTRNEISVIMSNLLNLDYDYYRGTNPFTDVPSWAAPYVAACYAEGVTAGAGNGLYNGSGNVTAAEASLMIMKALGYFQYQNDFGDDWQIATIRQASYINLFDGINANAETALTRNQIAQLVLNGLKANMVTFTGSVGAQIGDVSVGYVPEYSAITNANKKYDSIDVGTTNIGKDDQFYVQLGEELYNGDLKLDAATDVFGRPAYTWEYKSTEIGTYMDDSRMLQEYTAEVTGDMLYNLLTRNTVNTYEMTVVIDGVYEDDVNNATATAMGFFDKTVINRNNDKGVGNTGNGVLTQVFVDNDSKEITVAIINTYLALANKDYDAKKDEIGFDIYGINSSSDNYYKDYDSDKSLKVIGEEFDISDMKEKDAVLVTVADGEIQTITDCEMIAGTVVDAFGTTHKDEAGDTAGKPDMLEIDGTEYKFASSAKFDAEVMDYYTNADTGTTNLKDLTYNVYLDAYGYVIGVEEVEEASNYLFITGIETDDSYLGNRNATATAIFLDGTVATIDINVAKSTFTGGINSDAVLNSWFTYTVNTSKVYTVTEVGIAAPLSNRDGKTPTKAQAHTEADATGDDEAVQIDDRHITLNGTGAGTYNRVYGTDDTVYLTVSLDELHVNGRDYGIIKDVESVVTGIGNADINVWSQATARAEAENKDLNGDGTLAAVALNQISRGVYALYNKDGDVIAAVVVGEDSGASKNLVYVNSANVYRESYNATTDTYTWSRKVISNGQEIILTEVGDGLSELKTMVQHTWYEVKFNAEGNVIDVSPASAELTWPNLVVDYYNLGNAIDATDDTILYYSAGGRDIDTDDLKLVGKTLWLDGTGDHGFRVAEDVNIALIQRNNNTTKTYYESGVSSLKNIISDLNERHEAVTHVYEISAIIEDGVATSLVIRDDNTACDPAYKPGDWETDKRGVLDIQSLNFAVTLPNAGGTGMLVTFDNKTTVSLNGAAVDVVVRTESGVKVYSGSGIMYNAAAGATGCIAEFTGFTQGASNTGVYTVELTTTVAGKTYTGTATVATV